MESLNWFDLVVITLFLVTLVMGYISGLVMQLAKLVGLILGGVFAGKLSEFITPYLIQIAPSASNIIGPLSYIIAFILILLVMFLLGKTLHASIKAMQLSPLNRMGGAVFSVIKWFFLFSILINLLIGFDQGKTIIKEDVRKNAFTYPFVTGISTLVIPYLNFDWLTDSSDSI